MESIAFATTNLQIEKGCKIGYFFLDGSQSNHTIKLSQTFSIINSLRSLIRNIVDGNGHQLFIRKRRDIHRLQTLSLLSHNLIEELTHGTSVGKVFLTGIINLSNHLERQLLSIGSKAVLLLTSKDFHNLIELIWRVVFNVEEIAETAAEANIDAEEVFHLRAITCSNHYKLSTVVFHTFHQLLQSLCTLIVALATLAKRSQCIGLVNKEDTTHSFIAKAVHHLGSFTLIGANHLRTVNLNNMSTIQIANRLKYLTQLTGNGGLTCTRITSKDNMNTHLLLLA